MTRLERMIRRRQGAAVARVAATVRAEFPDLTVRQSESAVILSGPGLWRRRLADARLRGIAATVREGRS